MMITRRDMLLQLRSTRERRALWWTLGIVLASFAYGWRVLIAGAWPLWLELVRRIASIEWSTFYRVFPLLRDVV